jgi:hypothetical protein
MKIVLLEKQINGKWCQQFCFKRMIIRKRNTGSREKQFSQMRILFINVRFISLISDLREEER